VRIGLIADVHGNLPALEAVLEQLSHEAVDRTVCLGDVAVGPWGSETVALLRNLDPESVVGNWDAWVLDGVRPCGDTEACRRLLEMGTFWTEPLDGDDLDYLRRARSSIELEVDGRRLAFCHGSPRSYNEPMLAETPPDELAGMLAGHAATVFVAGHTHVQMVRRTPSALVVNPGSVGQPLLEWPAERVRVCPWAEWGVIEYDGEGEVRVELRRTPYDTEAMIRHTLGSGVPHAEWWTSCWERP
jgi:putative phosphoesterase